MTKRTHIGRLLAAACCAAALLGAGCGSDNEGKELPKSSVAVLQNQLNSIESRVQNGACQDVTDGSDPNTRVVQAAIDGLPSDVDKDTRDALQESFDNLFSLVRDECAQANTETQTTPSETIPTVTETTPTPTETTTTETTPTQTTTTPAPSKPKKPKKPQGNGGGGGQQAPEGQ